MKIVTRMNALAQDNAIVALQVEVDKLRDAVRTLKAENHPIYMRAKVGVICVEVPQRQALSMLANRLLTIKAGRQEQLAFKKPQTLWQWIKGLRGVWS